MDPWVVTLVRAGTPAGRVDESLATLADGTIGTRGTLEEGGPTAAEMVIANGVWTQGPLPVPLPCPLWTRVVLADPEPGTRWLDLRTGVLTRRVDGDPPLESLRFASAVRPGVVGLEVRGPIVGDGGPPVQLPVCPPGVLATTGTVDGRTWASTSGGRRHVVAVGTQRTTRDADGARLRRLVAYVVADDLDEGRDRANVALDEAEGVGFDALLAEHRAVWEARWDAVDVEIADEPELTRQVRFALFHVLSTVPTTGEAAVAARGLSGSAYAGHVFWDADVFVLPVLAATRPDAARAMLAYRLARLDAARAAARAEGRDGALFPWESAADGDDVTPSMAVDESGAVVPILTGQHAAHITADVAWAACHYATWSGDRAWLHDEGRDLVLEPARYWASRITLDPDGSAHIRGVVGPDEYHAPVDDDTYTNVLARWNLRAAAALASEVPEAGIGDDERARWHDLANRLVEGLDPATGSHEPFAGANHLEPLVISTIADVPVAADVLLGHDRVARAQVYKQPAVLMAHHLLPDAFDPATLPADLDHEGPRLAHGSSLSPPIHAAALARAGRPDDAVHLFAVAARLDLHDVTGTTAGGLHLASMGGVWQALVAGFAGVRATDAGLRLRPQLPTRWHQVTVNVRFHGVRVRVAAGHDEVVFDTDGPVRVQVDDGPWTIIDGARTVPRAPTPVRPEVA